VRVLVLVLVSSSLIPSHLLYPTAANCESSDIIFLQNPQARIIASSSLYHRMLATRIVIKHALITSNSEAV
jgi:hypothetical protein